MLQTCHSPKAAGHPGKNQLFWAISQQFWWPSLRANVTAFVAACSVCAQSKTPQHLPVGLLQPIPNGERPWTHLSNDYIVEIPNSQGNTVILMVVDRFSEMFHCIPLKKLPTSKELASIFAWEIFHLHRLPKVIVSDRGSQFVFVHSWEFNLLSPLRITHSLMGQQNKPISLWRNSYVAIFLTIITIG